MNEIRMVRVLGYARVSTEAQNLDLQMDALEKAGCHRVYHEKASGSLEARPELDRCLAALQKGDTLVIWRLDRLARSLQHLVKIVHELESRGVAFRSLQENIDTTTAASRFVFHLFAAVGEFERNLIQERTHAGLAAARARGRRGGRKSVMTPQRVKVAQEMFDSKRHSLTQIAKTLGVGRSTVYRALQLR